MDMEKNDIVISGISGRFPESANVEEFWENLINGVDMVTANDRRWPQGFADIPIRKGLLKNSLDEFDAEAFRINQKRAERLDPQIRQLLEVTFESLLDGGHNPSALRGKNIGVYVGASSHETYQACSESLSTASGYDINSVGCMFANQISYAFDFKGPSFTVDTYCSSSLMAFHTAVSAIWSGDCEGAVVGGLNLLLNPVISLQVKKLGVLSEDGKCKSFDASGDGYVRSDGIVAVFITKRSLAPRSYGTVLHSKSNSDGYKENGLTFPSGIAQERLMRETYEEAKINTKDVFYVEAHGTGTVAGDTQELTAISNIFCQNRTSTSPLLIGSTKSNMGHSEAASSLCSVVKVVLAMQRGIIPRNLHFEKPMPTIQALLDGKLKVVTENTAVTGSIFGINASGIGGSNIHVILQAESQQPTSSFQPFILPTLVPFSGRTLHSVNFALEKIVQERDMSRNHLLRGIHEQRILEHEFRGFVVVRNEENDISSNLEPIGRSQPPLWFIFSGNGTQWSEMAKEIIAIDIIKESLETSAEVIKQFGLDLIDLLVHGTEEFIQRHLSLSHMAIGIALLDFLKVLEVEPTGYIGHSAGESLCAYIDGCITREEALTISYYKDAIVKDCEVAGGMASVGLTWEEALTLCPPNVHLACHNAEDNVTVSGVQPDVTNFVQSLKAKGIFARELATGGVPFHSPYLQTVSAKFKAKHEEIIQNSRKRSSKWLSTCLPMSKWHTPLAQTYSTEYAIVNFLSPVLFYDVVKQIPPNAVVLEVSGHAIFQNILKKSLPQTCTVVPMMRRGVGDNLKRILCAVGLLFQNGLQPKISKIHSTPASLKTKTTISSLVKWNYSEKHALIDYLNKTSNSEHLFKISLEDEKYKYLEGHKIDGRVLFPATGYLVLVWEVFATLYGRSNETLGVHFENVSFHRAIVLSDVGVVELHVNIFRHSGDFQITEKEAVVVTGKIKSLEPDSLLYDTVPNTLTENVMTEGGSIYKDLRLLGYEYSETFQRLINMSIDGKIATISWQNQWIPFLDAFLQAALLSFENFRGLMLPTHIRQTIIDPLLFHKELQLNGSFETRVSLLENGSVNANGIYLDGVKFTSTRRRKTTQASPLIQNWTFVPYFDDERTKWDFLKGLKICIDIVVENTMTKIITIDEICEEKKYFSLFDSVKEMVVSNPSRKVSRASASFDLQIIHTAADLQQIALNPEKYNDSAFILFISQDFFQSQQFIEKFWNLIAFKRTTTNTLYLFRKKMEKRLSSETVIQITNENFEWLVSLKEAIANVSMSSRIWLTSSQPESGIIGFVNCLLKEDGSESIRSVFSQSSSDLLDFMGKFKEDDLVMNVIDSGGIIGSYRNFNTLNNLPDFPTEHAYLNVLKIGDLSSVKWIQAPQHGRQENSLRESCQVFYVPLNFRDIMLAIGKLSSDSLPGKARMQECVLGLEFVGLDSKGRRIMGVVESMGLATHVMADKDFIWRVPDDWSMEEGATVPIAYSTAYYSLVVRGGIKMGESVFITSGAGGVGLAAIAIAQNLNCEIFTTVGSEQKKQFLMEQFPQLKEDHILSSRNTKFEQEILRLTNKIGVSLVLNSLAEEKLQAGIRTLAKGGRFLEIGKFDMSKNTALGMEIFLRNISFHGILLDDLLGDAPLVSREKSEVIRLVAEGIQSGVVKPLPRRIFHHSQAEEAFRFMASGKHTGKVILEIRNEASLNEESNCVNIDSKFVVTALPRTYFHPEKVYVMIGGLGGFGLEISSWLVRRGVRILVLLSRSGVTNGYQEMKIRRWKELGINVLLRTEELCNVSNVETLLQDLSNYGQIGGIFNLAMVLKDGLLENQTIENFEAVIKPKFLMMKLFDQASRNCCPALDYFVAFSSVSSVYGNCGQSNYGMGNSAMERICEMRRKCGFPGIVIAFGAIGDVGVAQEKMGGVSLIGGTLLQRLSSCLEVMDTILHSEFQKTPNFSGIVSSMVLPSSTDLLQNSSSITKVEETLRRSIGKILGLTEAAFGSKEGMRLSELGLDSLMVLEVKQLLKTNELDMPNSEIRNLTWEKLIVLEGKQQTLKK